MALVWLAICAHENCRSYDGCGGGSFWGSWFEYRPTEGDSDGESWFVVHTSDPTSPTLRVPIVFDLEGRYLLPPMTPGYDITNWDHVWARPNPIRIEALPAGESATIGVCLDSEGEPEVTDISVWGEGLSVTGIFDAYGASCALPMSTGGPFPRSLEVKYDSSECCGLTYHHEEVVLLKHGDGLGSH